MRTGALYMSVGFDAVMLMEHAGLQATTAAHRSPCSQLQCGSLRRTLQQLLAAGHGVVGGPGAERPHAAERAALPDPCLQPADHKLAGAWHLPCIRRAFKCDTLPSHRPQVVVELADTTRGRRERVEGGVVSPASPEYTMNLIDEDGGPQPAAATAAAAGPSGGLVVGERPADSSQLCAAPFANKQRLYVSWQHPVCWCPCPPLPLHPPPL